MYKTLAVWTAAAVAGLIVNPQLMAGDWSSDRDLVIGGAIIMHPNLMRPDGIRRGTSSFAASTPKSEGVFADVGLEMWNMENRLFAALRGVEHVAQSIVKPISVE
ncbi:hypothetical protein [Schlesneria paludicola]|uniref:hypothetical protein n=1 Tax=Schlesneria paludicola TaxID=360056 RepID=UPI00029B1EFD|nr:hypothetical protein [Schlesneria paludicola]